MGSTKQTDEKVVILHLTPDAGSAEIDAALRGLNQYVETGVVPDGANITLEDFKTWTARGRLEDCDCGLLQCACAEARQHKKECVYRLALTCAIPIECEEHKRDVCPICDLCTCGGQDATTNR